jgi:hypothetical protein
MLSPLKQDPGPGPVKECGIDEALVNIHIRTQEAL